MLAAALVVGVLADQMVQHLLLADGYFASRRIAPYDPPIFYERQERTFRLLDAHMASGEPPAALFRHDPELGWCPIPGGTIRDQHYDWAGARIGNGPLARDKRVGVRRIVTVGCSFTLGTEVGDAESWAARLEVERPDLELANLGVDAYGVDQALLRYRRHGPPLEPDEVWLGFLPSAVLRATTLYRPAQMHWGSGGLFKPRFMVTDDGSLRLVSNPAPSLERTHHLLTHQAEFVAALRKEDPWVRRCPSAWAPMGSSPFHHSGFARVVLTAIESRGRVPFAMLADPESEARRLVRAIALEFHREVSSANGHFRLLVLPGTDDLRHWHANPRAAWLGLTEDLEREGVDVIDLSPHLPAPHAPGWEELWAPGGHYSVEGNRLVARLLASAVE